MTSVRPASHRSTYSARSSGRSCRTTAALDQGFAFRGRRIPFLNFQKGIYKAAAQSGPAALSVNTSYKSPYDDQETPDGFIYAYRAGDIDQPDNRALRAAFQLQVPIVYFVGTRPGWYRPEWPVFVTGDDPIARAVTLTPGRMVGPYDEREPLLPDDPIERRYAVRETRVRLHQTRFRARVLPAYANQCAICRLKETRLLDAAHIVGDAEREGPAGRQQRAQPLHDPPPRLRRGSRRHLTRLRGARRPAAARGRGRADARPAQEGARDGDPGAEAEGAAAGSGVAGRAVRRLSVSSVGVRRQALVGRWNEEDLASSPVGLSGDVLHLFVRAARAVGEFEPG